MIPFSLETTVTAVPSEHNDGTWQVVIAKPGLHPTKLHNFPSQTKAQQWVDENAWKWTPTAVKVVPPIPAAGVVERPKTGLMNWLRLRVFHNR